MLAAGEFTDRHCWLETSIPRVLTILSFVLEKLVARNNTLVDDLNQQLSGISCGSAVMGKNLDVLHGVRPPSVSIPKYLERLYKYTDCSPSCFVVGYVYIDRLLHKHPDSLVLSLNVHRLLVTSVMVASKMLDDVHYNNAFYARVGGVSNAELNKLEVELLFLLDFGVMVSSRVFESYCFHLEKENMQNGACQRIERPLLVLNGAEDVPEISENTESSSSPPQISEVTQSSSLPRTVDRP
ncbi:cyclin-U1-1-like [Pyrus ussuriensis x Pyrus communis]|uniref:Cyclin-U1-1-like n=1 Tax=Pyrus ussuriensis x Pyrus communis TaxID=2448454 RepID=A0A5N5G5C9_9ROSA|nr:cyclin-U1-1-like [Pyrus ussuriensis x Pyrus communis]